MPLPDDLNAILDRIRNGKQTEADLAALRQLLNASSAHGEELSLHQNVLQVGKYNVSFGEGKNIQIGDRTYYGADVEAIENVLRKVLQELQPASSPIIPTKPRSTSQQQGPISNLQLSFVSFPFDTVFAKQGKAIQREQRFGKQWIEDLGKGIHLETVAILGGEFLMGSPVSESGRVSTESPQHRATVSELLMSKYPITQAQWKVVAGLPQIHRSLRPKPSKYKGNDLPVEGISWFEAIEFCDRLAQYTGCPYRLPSEAEWEYACRAGTQTAFHVGEVLSPEFANYRCEAQSSRQKGRSKGCTTTVGSYQVANAFGLYDLHGNVSEWCLDGWDDHYQDAPVDGSARMKGGDNQARVIRGGSWFDPPSSCRCAARDHADPEVGSSTLGLRVVLSLH